MTEKDALFARNEAFRTDFRLGTATLCLLKTNELKNNNSPFVLNGERMEFNTFNSAKHTKVPYNSWICIQTKIPVGSEI